MMTGMMMTTFLIEEEEVMGGEEPGIASTPEVDEAIRGMSDSDFLRLRKASQWFLEGDVLGYRAEDLVNEAFGRALAGGRRWNRSIPFLVFITNAMRSIASELREKRLRRPEDLDRGGDNDDVGASDFRDDGPDAEEMMIAKESERRILDVFKGKDTEVAVIMGMMDGMTAAEIKTTCELTDTTYESARKAIQRARPLILKITGRGSDS